MTKIISKLLHRFSDSSGLYNIMDETYINTQMKRGERFLKNVIQDKEGSFMLEI